MLARFISSLSASQAFIAPPVEEPQGAYTFRTALQDHSYSWWCWDMAKYDAASNCYYLTTIALNGSHWIHRLLPNGAVNSLQLHIGIEVDEHNTAAFLIREDHILVMYCGHKDPIYYVERVAKDLSASLFKKNIYTEAALLSSTYAQIHEHNGRVFNLSRFNDQRWALTWSDDNGTTWVPKKILMWKGGTMAPAPLPGGSMYCLSQRLPGSKIRMVIYLHPITAGNNNRLMALELDLATGEVTSAGVSQGNIYAANWNVNNGVDLSYLTPIYNPPAGEGFRLLNMAGDGDIMHILYARLVISEHDAHFPSGDYVYRQVRASTLEVLQTIPITSHGKDHGYNSYIGGAYFAKTSTGVWNNQVYLCRENAGTWTLEHWAFDGTAFSRVAIVDTLSDGNSLTRPQVFIDAPEGGIQFVYQKGNYFGNFIKWDNELITVET